MLNNKVKKNKVILFIYFSIDSCFIFVGGIIQKTIHVALQQKHAYYCSCHLPKNFINDFLSYKEMWTIKRFCCYSTFNWMLNVVPKFFCVLQHLHKIDFVISAVKNFLTLNVINILFSSFSPIIRIHEERAAGRQILLQCKTYNRSFCDLFDNSLR